MSPTPAYPSLTKSYRDNVALMDDILRVKDNFDLIRKDLVVGSDRLTMYYIDGFVKDTVMQKLMMHFASQKGLEFPAGPYDDDISVAQRFVDHALPYVETDVTAEVGTMVQMVLSGATLMLGSAFGAEAEPLIRPVGAKYYVNLKEMNALVLRRAGVEQIDISTDCTACQNRRFWSHRITGGQRGSQGAVIVCQRGKA